MMKLLTKEFWLQPDKKLHAVGSLALTLAFYIISSSILVALSLALIVGVLKEAVDYISRKSWFPSGYRGNFDWYDLLADCIGIVIGGLILWGSIC